MSHASVSGCVHLKAHRRNHCLLKLRHLAAVQALRHCQKLEEINFTWCVQLTDEGLAPVVAGCLSLKSLSLHGLRGITNCTIEVLAKHCRESLHTLDVHGCIGIKTGESSVQAYLQKQLPHVTKFVIHT